MPCTSSKPSGPRGTDIFKQSDEDALAPTGAADLVFITYTLGFESWLSCCALTPTRVQPSSIFPGAS